MLLCKRSSFSIDGIYRAAFQFVHSFVEEFSDPRPTKFDDKDQDWQSDGRNDQDRLDADCTTFIGVDPFANGPQRHRIVSCLRDSCLFGLQFDRLRFHGLDRL